METEELIEHILRQKHLEEMMNRPEKEHTPLEGMDNEQIKRFALFLFEGKHSDKCTFYTLRFDCSFAAANTIKPQLL